MENVKSEEIDDEVKRLHAEAEKKILELKMNGIKETTIESLEKEKGVEDQEPVSPEPLKIVAPKAIRTFFQWFRDYKFGPELEAINRRRGLLVPLMTAYTNLDILRTLGEISNTLKEIPDLIQDQVDATETMRKEILTKLDEIKDDNSSETTVRKRGVKEK